MHLKKNYFIKKVLAGLISSSLLFSSMIYSHAATEARTLTIDLVDKSTLTQMEYLDRGLVAAKTETGIFLSWRLKVNEVNGYSSTGLTGADFNVYRDGVKIANVDNSTNYLDTTGTTASRYCVCSVINGMEVDKSPAITPWNNYYYDLPLKKPADGVTPKGETYTYSANDMSVGDVDGDGVYEYFVKWDPSNAKDVSQVGYTGIVYLDCYKFDGTLLYRIDLGKNIRAGAHYTQFMVYDFDGDGKAEVILKTAPGTKVVKYDTAGNVMSEKYITMLQEDINAGYSHKDDYRTSGPKYIEYLVKMFMNWDKHVEVINGNWPKTLEECFGIPVKYNYPLSKADAEELVNYYVDTFAHKAPKDTNPSRNNLRQFEGFIIEGPEYLSVFNGETGSELETIRYKPGRLDDGLMWGDHAMGRIEPGNRVDRMLAGVSYLDGKKPYAVFARGYYTRSTLVTYSWDGKHLNEYWYVDSGFPVMKNPFNDGPHGLPGRNTEYASMTTQGAHSMTTVDVDDDGCDEIIFGSATIDHNGKLLYVASDLMPTGSVAPGTIGTLGHGDSIHVTDINPNRPGLEIFMCHEGGLYSPYGSALRDAKTGEIIFGAFSGKDTGRAMVGDIDPTKPGLELWANGFWQADGTAMPKVAAPGTNQNVRWSADMTTQVLNGSRTSTPVIQKWDYTTNKVNTLLTLADTYTNNDTKGSACLVADIFGDWREEVLVRKTDSSAVRIYLSTELTNHKMYTLMQDIQYRTDIARQNDGYNQPAYTSFYFASDMDWSKVPIRKFSIPNIAGVNLNKYSTNILVGAQELLKATVVPSNLDQSVAWYTYNPSIATISSSGLITAISPGIAVIKAASVANSAYYASCTVVVNPSATSVNISKSTANLKVGTSEALRAIIMPSNADQNVIWTSSDSNVATVLQNGYVTGEGVGTAVIKATCVSNPNLSTTCNITVTPLEVKGIGFNKTKISIPIGNTEKLTAIILPVKATDKSIAWKSDNEEIATVKDGIVTGLKEGTVNITATSLSNPSICRVCTVTVNYIGVTGLSLSKNTTSLQVGSTETLKATVLPANATEKAVLWNSSNEQVVEVKDGTITALKEGTATIKVTSVVDSVYTASCDITVISADSGNDTPSGGTSDGGTIVNPSTVNSVIKVTPTLDKTSRVAAANISAKEILEAFKQGKTDSNGDTIVSVEFPRVEGVLSYGLNIPISIFNSLNINDTKKKLEVNTDIANVILPSNIFSKLGAIDSGDITLSISNVDKSSAIAVTHDTAGKIGDRQIVDISLMSNGKKVIYDKQYVLVQIAIPYIATADELKEPEHITVLSIDSKGKVSAVPTARYDSAKNIILFETNKLNQYGVAFVHKTFEDIGDLTWAKKSIEVLSSKGIINGTTERTFDAYNNITRGDFTLLLVRALGLSAKVETNFQDVNADDYYYEALGIAKNLGIAKGDDNNKFNPNGEISRQDMMVLAARAMKLAKKLDSTGSISELAGYSDKTYISDYAVSDISTLVKEGIIKGNGNNIDPLGFTTRAEAAALIYRIYNK